MLPLVRIPRLRRCATLGCKAMVSAAWCLKCQREIERGDGVVRQACRDSAAAVIRLRAERA